MWQFPVGVFDFVGLFLICGAGSCGDLWWRLGVFDLCGVDSGCGFDYVDLFLRPIASDQDPPTGRPLLASVFLLLVGA